MCTKNIDNYLYTKSLSTINVYLVTFIEATNYLCANNTLSMLRTAVIVKTVHPSKEQQSTFYSVVVNCGNAL